MTDTISPELGKTYLTRYDPIHVSGTVVTITQDVELPSV